MNELDRFQLEGIVYYQQGRKCGRPGCRCEAGDLHGPYWYARDSGGRVRYLGRVLPDAITRARAARRWHAPDIERTRRQLRNALDAVEKLLRYDDLSDADRMLINVLGFGDCLVCAGGHQVTQDQADLVELCGTIVAVEAHKITDLCATKLGDTQDAQGLEVA